MAILATSRRGETVKQSPRQPFYIPADHAVELALRGNLARLAIRKPNPSLRGFIFARVETRVNIY